MDTRQTWARRPLAAALCLAALAAALAPVTADEAEERLRKDVTFLASAECEGRGITTEGINKAADYIVAQFKAAGLKPGGPGGSWFQPFPVNGPGKLVDAKLTLHGLLGQSVGLRLDKDFTVMGFSGSGKVVAPVVFVGHGITAPGVEYDDFKGVDVKGKVVLMLRRTPRWANDQVPFDERRKTYHAELETKLANAELNSAAAVLFVNDQSELAAGDPLMSFGQVAGSTGGGTIPSAHVRYDVADAMVRASLGTGLRDLEQAIARDLKPRSAPLAGWKVALQTDVPRQLLKVKNVVGVLEGSGKLADETIVIGAHYDHLGYGGRGSLAKNKNEKAIHHGADDNASGTSVLIELARRFAAHPKREGRRLVFIAFSAEESGLLGSRYYCNRQQLFPLSGTAAMVNLDMVGRMTEDPKSKKEKLLAEGVGTAKEFGPLLDGLNKKHDLALVIKQGGTGPSDHDSFVRKDVPVLFFWTGTHSDYHRPSDKAEKINVRGMRRVADLSEEVVAHLAAVSPRPEYVHIASSFQPTVKGGIPRLGIMPSYEDNKAGVLVDGVSDKGPAALGGLKAGDRIVSIAGREVPNINAYMTILAQQKRGQPLEVGVVRDGKELKLKVTPQ